MKRGGGGELSEIGGGDVGLGGGGRTGRRHGEHGDLLAAISLHQGELLVSMWTMGIGASYLHQHGTSTFSQVPQLTLIWT